MNPPSGRINRLRSVLEHHAEGLVFFLAAASVAIALLRSHAAVVGGTDETSYLEAAFSFLRGDGIQTIPLLEITKRPPVYPMFLAAGFRLFGHFRAWIVALNVASFLTTVAVTFRLANELRGRVAALIAGALVATHPALLNQLLHPMAEPLFTAFLMSAVYQCALASRHGGARHFVAGGCSAALAALTKPVATYSPVFLLAGAFLCGRPILSARAFARGAIIFGGSFLMVLYPWAIRNRLLLGSWVPVSTYGPMGVSLSVESIGSANGGDDVETGLHDFPLTELWEETNRLPERDATRVWASTLTSYFHSHLPALLTYAAAMPRRWFYVLDFGRNAAPPWGDPWGFSIGISPDVVILLLPVVLVIDLRRRDGALALPFMIVLYFLAIHSFAIALPRYREPVIPLILIIAASVVAGRSHRQPAPVG